jgi:nucleoid-associated protein YgaU
MALTGTGNVLGDAVKAAIDAIPEDQRSDRTLVFRAMGTAIINHIIANGASAVQISGQPVAVGSVTLVVPGVGASGPGAGTCSGVANIV